MDTGRLTSYAKAAARTVLRDGPYSAVSVVGLAVGLACSLLVALFVLDELRHDRWMPKADRIYRLVTPKGGQLPPRLGPMLRDLPEVEDVVRINAGLRPMIVSGQQRSFEPVSFVDPNFPHIFDIYFVLGDPVTALTGHRKMVLSEAAAAALFGEADPRGEILSWDGTYDYEVTGVARVPSHTHFPFHILGSMSSMDDAQFWHADDQWQESFSWQDRYTYVVLAPSADPAVVPGKVYDLIGHRRSREAQEIADRWGGFQLQRLTDIHLRSRLPAEIAPNGRIEHVVVAIAVAVLVLLIASINHVNLSLARSARRAREIGLRKTVGAGRGQLVGQLLGESVFVSWLAFLIGLGLARLALPTFNSFFLKSVSLADPLLLGIAFLAATILGLLSGAYPALVLSRWEPATILKGDVRRGGRSALRQLLGVGQFAGSVGLIVATGVVLDQVHYLRTTDLGFRTDRTLLITTAYPAVQPRICCVSGPVTSAVAAPVSWSVWLV